MEIIDYPNYLIYEDGRVQNKTTKRFKSHLNPSKTNPYFSVMLCKNNKRKGFQIHRLIALHYIPNPENKEFVNHIDGNKLNNNIENLEWCSNIENLNSYYSKNKNNTSGHKNICYEKSKKKYRVDKSYYGKKFQVTCKDLNSALWIKFIMLLNIKKHYYPPK